jgi:hypothetical protein
MDYTSLSPVLIVEDDRKTVALIALYPTFRTVSVILVNIQR